MKDVVLWCLFSALILPACGNDATFRGSALKKLNIPGVEEPEGDEEPTTIVDDDQPIGDVVIDGDGNPEGIDDGDTDSGTDTSTTDTTNSVDAVARLAMTWSWPCDNRTVTASKTMIVGEGSHVLAADLVDLKIEGEVCEPSEAPRDVIFVVDVSDSMRGLLNFGNDPLKQGSCGRLNAVTAVVSTMRENDRVGFATFDGSLQQFSAGFLSANDFMDQYGSSDVFCEAGANTNFKRGLEKAEDILAGARDDSSREVYFISDGESSSDATIGREVAARIRSEATLATMMLKGNDKILKEDLATHVGGIPLHTKVDNAADMADALATLARRKLVAAHLRWGDSNELELDIDQDQFELPPLSLDASSGSFIVEVDMVDSAGVTWSRVGVLK